MKRVIVSFVGGAAGVGKSSLLAAQKDCTIFNTGTFFKRHMSSIGRDDIRKGDWSICEKDVVADLVNAVLLTISKNKIIIIDTHFAAKIYNRHYRVGLNRNLVFDLATSLVKNSIELEYNLTLNVILIYTDPHLLLERRRNDSTRDRELIPSDCVIGLKRNDFHSHHYYYELVRSNNQFDTKKRCTTKYYKIENMDLLKSIGSLTTILK